ncbi:2'-5' RNA ligase [Betaproteobacteria bacterium GR16-43]|nr:2'-5' RNA ligase [Betaproteobacteria bacterium GR16-43]
MARHFFALWPPEGAAESLEALGRDLAGEFGGRPTARHKIHVTLAFLGEIEADAVTRACELAAGIRMTALDLVLDQAGWFRGPRVGWAGCSAVPAELANLARSLAGALGGAGIAVDDRPYVPHATLVRKVARPIDVRMVPPIGWRAQSFVLVASEGGNYRIRGRWETR